MENIENMKNMENEIGNEVDLLLKSEDSLIKFFREDTESFIIKAKNVKSNTVMNIPIIKDTLRGKNKIEKLKNMYIKIAKLELLIGIMEIRRNDVHKALRNIENSQKFIERYLQLK